MISTLSKIIMLKVRGEQMPSAPPPESHACKHPHFPQALGARSMY